MASSRSFFVHLTGGVALNKRTWEDGAGPINSDLVIHIGASLQADAAGHTFG